MRQSRGQERKRMMGEIRGLKKESVTDMGSAASLGEYFYWNLALESAALIVEGLGKK